LELVLEMPADYIAASLEIPEPEANEILAKAQQLTSA
jgi:hypothetical protein